MLIITTSAKTLDWQTPYTAPLLTPPVFLNEAKQIAAVLQKKSVNELRQIFVVSEALARLNYDRLKLWEGTTSPKKARAALFSYKGDIYREMHPETYNDKQALYAQRCFRTVSGLYGLVRPYDLIMPYRLEMKAIVAVAGKNNLYDFWRAKATEELNKEARELNHSYLINLASEEYAKIVDPNKLSIPMITIEFNQIKNGDRKTIPILSKKARGMMIEYMIQNMIEKPEGLKGFTTSGYRFDKEGKNRMIFLKTIS